MFGTVPTDRKMVKLIEEFSGTVNNIFEHSSPLMSFSPSLAKKFNLKIWTKFDASVTETLKLATTIINIGLRRIDPKDGGLMTEMMAADMSPDVIKRIFVDLIIAAGDTVNTNSTREVVILSQLVLSSCY